MQKSILKNRKDKESEKEAHFCSVEFSSYTGCEGGEGKDGDNGKAYHEPRKRGLFHDVLKKIEGRSGSLNHGIGKKERLLEVSGGNFIIFSLDL